MLKRLFCALLCLMMVLVLASPALAAKEMFQIRSVSLKVTAPTVGNNPVFQATVETENVFVVTDAPFPFVNGVNWHQYNPDNDLVESNTFQGGLRYKVTVRVRARSSTGGSFLKDANGMPNITGTINGITASVATVPGTTDVDLTLQFAALPKVLTTAGVTGIDAPVAGATPDYTAAVNSSDYKFANMNDSLFKNGITWYDCTDGKYVSTTHKFIAGHTYMVEVHLVPAGSETFSYDATGTVNGQSIGVVAGGGDEIALVYEFPACEEKAATSAPVITLQPQNPVWPEYSIAAYTVKASGSGLSATWYIEYNGKTYNMSDFTNSREPWEDYAGETYGPTADGNSFTCSFNGIESELSSASVYCVISNSKGQVTSSKSVISISGSKQPPVTEVPVSVTGYQGDSLEVSCKATGKGLSYTWYETSTGKLQDITAVDRGKASSATFKPDTSKAGTRYYVCGVQSSEGGLAYTSIVPVKVLEKKTTVAEPEITTKSLKAAVVGKEYKAKLECTDGDATFSIWYNPGKSNDFDKTGLTLTQHGDLEGTPTEAGTYTFCVCVAGEGGEGYKELTLKVVKTVEEAETEPQEETTAEVTEEPTTESGEDSKTTGRRKRGGANQEGDNMWWIIIPVVAVAAGLGIGVTVVILRKKKK